MFADLLAESGVVETVRLGSPFGFMAFHGGSLEVATDTIAGDLVAGVARGADAFMAATAISIGSGGVYQLWRLLPQAALP